MDFKGYLSIISPQAGTERPLPNIWVCGVDMYAQNALLNQVAENCRKFDPVLLITHHFDAPWVDGSNIQQGFMYSLSGPPLCLERVEDISFLRELFSCFLTDEKDKAAVISYLRFAKHLAELQGRDNEPLVETLCKIDSYSRLEGYLEDLIQQGRLDHTRRLHLLEKYSELSAAAADLSHITAQLKPFTTSGPELPLDQGRVFWFPLDMFANDRTLKQTALQLLLRIVKSQAHPVSCIFLNYGDSGLDDMISRFAAVTHTHHFTSGIMTEKGPQVFQTFFDMKNFHQAGSLPGRRGGTHFRFFHGNETEPVYDL